jgi:Tfp pilus assembly protein PilF
MGHNAASVPDLDRMAKVPGMPDFLRSMPGRPKPLKPAADVCFQKAIDLAPDLLEAHLALLHYHQEREEDKPAEKAARQLLKRFPDHAETLESLGDVLTRKGDHDEAITVFQHALRVNPLDREPQAKLETAFMFRARARAEAGRFDDARADYQTALSMSRGKKYPVLCKWAACEFKAGNPQRAEELLQQALGEADSKLAVTFGMLIEAIRLKLPQVKKRFNTEFNAALAEPAEVASAVAILDTVVSHKVAGVTYHGQKTHEKKVLTYVGKTEKESFTEAQLLSLCRSFLLLKTAKQTRQFAALGRLKFPRSPYFLMFEAESHMLAGPHMAPPYRVQPLLDQAMKLAEDMPRDPKQQELVKRIQELQRVVRSAAPLMNIFSGFSPFGAFDDYDEDDDDYDDGW